ncbi:MAG: type I-C CRISPR-associated protein Cas8c/Csd1 [Leptolinea sp.]|jgi:CRISPR-associated protein Csd1|nr:type I-C CRISPR-associated protein Cas8c/Csd1 [Leptolinea sp.]
MSWMQRLYETYENCSDSIGRISEDNSVPLLPVGQTTFMAHIEIVLDAQGKFLRAKVIKKREARTIIPCSERSGGRTGNLSPHPLCDKLQYIASNYAEIGGSKKPAFDQYIKSLEDWCASDYSDRKIEAILKYLKQNSLTKDLGAAGVLHFKQNGKLIEKAELKSEKASFEIFEVLTNQADANIRWVVQIHGDLVPEVWKDKNLWDKWMKYYLHSRKEKGISFISGKEVTLAEQHPAKIRNDGDKAKIISSNDNEGFTFRGRFSTGSQTVAIGYEETQKAHAALRWLISRQGFVKDDLAFVTWATSGVDIPKPTDDTFDLLGFGDMAEGKALEVFTAQDTAIQLRKMITGYRQTMHVNSPVVVLGLDSATPGRLSIVYFQQLAGSDFLDRIEKWHSTCAWKHGYRSVDYLEEKTGKKKKRYKPFFGAPAPGDIADVAFGKRLDEKLRRATIKRIMPCIVEGQPIPRDLVELTYRRAVNRLSMEPWEWEKTLSIACALFCKFKIKEKYTMSLDPERKSRDYLYGRLLALAESLEEWALNKAGEDRETNAARLMQRFADHPYTTWKNIELALVPYKSRLGGKSKKRQRLMDEVIASFDENDFLNDHRLSGEFLLGYHCQREALRNATTIDDDSEK